MYATMKEKKSFFMGMTLLKDEMVGIDSEVDPKNSTKTIYWAISSRYPEAHLKVELEDFTYLETDNQN